MGIYVGGRLFRLYGPVVNNLPLQLTSFVGRERELAEIKVALDATRLLTLTGAGGCGKTRLALQIAAELAATGRYPDGVWWTELAALTDPSLVLETVASTLGVRAQESQPLLESLTAYLVSKRLLLLLDNCEHLVNTCAALAESLLRAVPGLQILSTSREALNIPGERLWSIPSLSLPEPQQRLSPSLLLEYDAIHLFVERAVDGFPAFSLTEQNAKMVVQICRRLDGIPLAIELASARVRMLTIEQLAHRLDDRFRLLAWGSRTAAPRHQSLWAAIDWSYTLLSEPERVLLRRFSVFVDGWTLEAAETICAGTDGQEGIVTADVLERLTQLVYKSLVVIEEQGGAPRYNLLESIRQYAAEQFCERQEVEQVQARHLTYFLQLAQETESKLHSSEQAAWLDRLEAEHGNLRAALQWALDSGRVEQALLLGTALWRFWYARGYLVQGRNWLETALAIAPHAHELPLAATQAAALNGAGGLAYAQGDYADAQRFYQESLRLRQVMDDRRGVSIALNNLGLVARNLGDYAKATDLLQQSIVYCQEVGDKEGIAYTLTSLGEVARCLNNYDQAASFYRESAILWRELDNIGGVATSLHNLGHVALYQQDIPQATAHFRDSLQIFQQLGNKRGIALCLAGLAGALSLSGKPQRAACLFGAEHALHQAIGARLEPADRIEHERTVAAVRAQLDEATFVNLWAAGAQMTVSQAIAYARAEDTVKVQPVAKHKSSSTQRAYDCEPDVGERSCPPALRFLALGPARVYQAGRCLTTSDWTYLRPKELLFYLLLHPPRTKEQIGLVFWPEATPAQVRNNFHVTLHQLRQTLGHKEWIVFEHNAYSVNDQLEQWFDVKAFQAVLAQAQQLRHSEAAMTGERVALEQAAGYLRQALQLYQGELLEDFMEGDWFVPLRAELWHKALDAYLTLGQTLFTLERYSAAAEIYRHLLARDSLVETAHRELMRCYARLGERSLGIRQYQTLRTLLDDELQTEPCGQTSALFERLVRGQEI
jgi:non-specific serine/threonine protein kinase